MTTPDPLAPPKTRNLQTQAQMRRDAFWQIGLPVGGMTLVALGAAVLMVSPAGAATRSPIADVSLMLLICPTTLFGLIFLAVIVGLCYGLTFGLRELPFLFKRAQDGMTLVAYYTKQYAARVAEVVVRVRTVLAASSGANDHLQNLIARWRKQP